MAVQTTKTYRLGNFSLDPQKRELTNGGRKVRLTNQPFQVLLYLIEHRSRMVSRNELIEQFWNGQEVYEENLTKCVGAIRKALDDQKTASRFIETRYGAGYRYIGPLQEQIIREETPAIEIVQTRAARIIIEEEEIAEPTLVSEVVPRLPLLKPTRVSARSAVFIAIAVLLTTAVGFVYFRSRTHATNGSQSRASIAVIPFKNMTGDAANEYLSEGITDSLITSLGRIETLKVIARGSVFAAKDRAIDPVATGKQLGVANLLQGSVLKTADGVRVEARLVSATDGRVLWATDQFEKAPSNILNIQDAIARQVVAKLGITLNQQHEQMLTRRYTRDDGAYEAYLKGRFFLNKRTAAAIAESIKYLQQAIKIDPNYALAYAALADAYDKAYWYQTEISPRDPIVESRAAAIRALAIDESLAEAHLAMATVHSNSWELAKAATELERALQIDPANAEAHHNYAYCLLHLGSSDRAIDEIKRARDLDPLNVVMNIDVGEVLLYARRYDEAIAALNHALQMESARAYAHYDLGAAYEQKGMERQAFEEYLRHEVQSGATGDVISALTEAYNQSGLNGFWKKKLEITRTASNQHYINPIIMARLQARSGNYDLAFEGLEKAFSERSPTMVDLNVDPTLDKLRSDPRFGQLQQRVGLNTTNPE